jgi:exodeoxyribonuclease V alpha subunit
MAMEELVAIFRRERHRWDDTVILDCDRVEPEDPVEPEPPKANDNGPGIGITLATILGGRPGGVIVKTMAEPGEMREGLTYRFYGRPIEHERFGRQFHAKSFVPAQPHGMAGTIRYLTSAPHVGPSRARTLWEKFGGDAVRILREQPDVAAAAVGGQFTKEKAKDAAEYLESQLALENVSIDMIDLLGGRGFPRLVYKAAVSAWGNRAAAMIRKNPFLLWRFPGCGWTRIDKLYLDLGHNPKARKRLVRCAQFTLAKGRDGHTWFQPEAIEAGIAANVGPIDRPEVVRVIQIGTRAGLLDVRRDAEGRPWVAEAAKAQNESDLAARIRELVTAKPHWPNVGGLEVTDHQREQLFNGLQTPIGVLNGSPGTGKTYVTAKLIGKIAKRFGLAGIAVAAPTGKAAVRISEAMAAHGLPIRATTIHRLLGVSGRSDDGDWGFKFNAKTPLPFRFVFVDEGSMVDTDLAAALFRAVGEGTHALAVGDPNQLPPVGHGAPLRDMIAAGVPTGDLREILRNAGSIVRACAAIRDGQPWQFDDDFCPPEGRNMKLGAASSGPAALEAIVATIKTLAIRKLADPIWDCQVIVAVNGKSSLGRREVNRRLQLELNAGGAGAAGSPFRVGDKIVCLKNGFVPVAEDSPRDANQDADDGKVFVANGEQARVLQVESRLTYAALEAPKRVIKVPRGDAGQRKSEGSDDDADDAGSDTGCQFDLAYAISCHKSQGSEYPWVFLGLDEYPGAKMVCSREWLYTGLSRAKFACVAVGRKSTADAMCLKQAIWKRKTFLRELVEE